MVKRVTIKDVANEAGVSIAMVSLVLHAKLDKDGNPECSVRKETAKRIFGAVKKLGYIPNRAAASIRSGRSYTIAVITSDISNSFFSKICKYIENLAYDQGYSVIFASSDESPNKFHQVLDTILRLSVDGMIIVPPPHSDMAIEKISTMNIPIVLLERDIPEIKNAGRVFLDNGFANRLAINELYSSGYRKIELITYDLEISTIRSRVEGYKNVMAQLGLSDSAKVHYIEYGADVNAMSTLLQNIVKRGCEAVFLATNTLSVRALEATRLLKLNIPKDLALVGFDYSHAFDVSSSSISHVLQPIHKLGEDSFTMLVEMIEEGAPGKTILLYPTLAKGDSSAPRG